MRVIPIVLCSTVLAAAIVVAPTVTVGATPKPVSPSIASVEIPLTEAGRAAAAAPSATPTAGQRRVVAQVKRSGLDYDVAGVTFQGATPGGMTVEARTHGPDGWSGWSTLEIDVDGGPDAGTAEASGARPGTDPIAAPGSDAIEVRVATLGAPAPARLEVSVIDAGSSTADSALGPRPGSAVASVRAPSIITRQQWGADESLSTCTPPSLTGYQAAVVHHTVNSNTYTESEAAGILRGIYAYHTTTLGWCDIGYQFLADRFGRLYEGRKGSLTGFVQGAQAGGFNSETVGVSVIGDHTSIPFSTATKSAVTQAIAWLADRSDFDPATTVTLTSAGNSKYPVGTIVTQPRVIGHRDLGHTACPGDTAYPQVPSIRSDAASVWRTNQWTKMSPSTVVETFARPSTANVTLSGRGKGHGIGMSQWGAFGAATKGLTWQQIAGFYYRGTTTRTLSDSSLRVWLSALGSGGLTVPAQSGLVVSDGTKQVTLSSTVPWRIVPDGGGLTLQSSTSSGWQAGTTWVQWTGGPLTLSRPGAASVRVTLPNGTYRDYAGSLRTHTAGSGAQVVDIVSIETYLRSVVPSEMSPSWPSAALRAQAVAARSYAVWSKSKPLTSTYDICDVTCQAYRGRAAYSSSGSLVANYEDSRSTAAVTGTAGTSLAYGGNPVLAQYSSSNGGRTAVGSQPYLVAVNDPYDGVVTSTSRTSLWTKSLAVSTIEASYPAIGVLTSIAVASRTSGGEWGGRAMSIGLRGSTGSVTVTGDAFRSKLGLPSAWWTITSAPARSTPTRPRDLSGDSLPDAIVPSSSGVVALTYSGSMSFAAKTLTSSSFSGLRLTSGIGPWDPDNIGDVVAATSDGKLWLYPGGKGGLLDQGRYAIGTSWGGINLIVPTGDFNGDGRTDFMARTLDGQLALYLGNGTGGFGGRIVSGTGFGGFTHIAGGDFDGNGVADILAVRSSDGRLFFYAGTGTGTLRTGVAVGTADWRFASLRSIGDLTGDGRHDLLARRSTGGLTVYQITGSAQVFAAIPAGTYTPTTVWGQ